MTIIIQGARWAPMWTTTQRMIREVTGREDGKLTVIERPDGGCNFREPGIYRLVFEERGLAPVAVSLVVVAPTE